MSRPNEETAGPGLDKVALTRRGLWKGAGIVAAAAAVGPANFIPSLGAAEAASDHPGYDPAFPPPGKQTAADYPVSEATRKLSTYISTALAKPLPPAVVEKTKWHLLDTLAAIVAGSQVPTGPVSRNFVRALGGKPVSTVIGSNLKTDPMTAALANGTMGHGHEVDDVGGASGPWHPGINVVSAALALGEQFDTGGEAFLRAIALGYDIGGRAGTAAGLLRNFRTPTVSVCGYFGAVAAAAGVAGLDEEQTRYALSYTVQQSSGVDSFRRDPDHIEKGFLNGGMGARGGITSVMLVLAGFTGVRDPFVGPANFFALFRAAGQEVHPEFLTAGLGERYDIMVTGFKRRPVAGAISAVIDSLEVLLRRQRVNHEDVREILIRYEPNSVTDNSGAGDVNVQHAVALMLVDGQLTFRSVHDRSRFQDPEFVRLRSIAKIAPVTIYVQSGKYEDPSIPGAAAKKFGSKVPVIELVLADGTRLSQGDVPVRGEASNPYTREWIMDKAHSLMKPVLGVAQSRKLIERVMAIETSSAREIASLLRTKREVTGAYSEWPADTKM